MVNGRVGGARHAVAVVAAPIIVTGYAWWAVGLLPAVSDSSPDSSTQAAATVAVAGAGAAATLAGTRTRRPDPESDRPRHPGDAVRVGISGRELTVIILTLIVIAVALVLALVSSGMASSCHTMYGTPNYGPLEPAFLVPLACVVPLGLALGWRLRPALWVSTLLALMLTPWIVILLTISAYCPD